MAAVKCQQLVTGSVRFSSQAPQVQTSRSDKQDNLKTFGSSVANGHASRGSSLNVPAAPPAVGTSITVQGQRPLNGSVRFGSQAPQVQTSRLNKQNNMNMSCISVANGHASKGSSVVFPVGFVPQPAVGTANAMSSGSSVVFPVGSVPPAVGTANAMSSGSSVVFPVGSVAPPAVGTANSMSSVQLSSFLPPPVVGYGLESGRASSRTSSMRFSTYPGLNSMLPLSSPSSGSYPAISVRMPVETANEPGRARSPIREHIPQSAVRERRTSLMREPSPRRESSPLRAASANVPAGSSVMVRTLPLTDVNALRPQSPVRVQSPIREHKLEQSFEQVLRDAVERGRQASPIRQASSIRQASPLRQTSSLQRQQSPLYPNFGSSVRLSSLSPLRVNSNAMLLQSSSSSIRFPQCPQSPRKPLPLPELSAPPFFMAPPPPLPSLPASQCPPGVPMPGMLPLQAAQQQSQAPRFPGLSPELTRLLGAFPDFKFTAEPDAMNRGASGSYPPGAMDDTSPPPRNAPAASRADSSMLDYSRERCATFITNESFIQQPAPYGRSLAPPTGEGSDRHILSIMTSDNTWDSLAFNSGENIEKTASAWLQKRGLNPAFQRGLVSQMRQMVNTKLITAAVDIVDLL